MWEIVGLLLLFLAIIMGIAFACDELYFFDGFYTKDSSNSKHKKQKHNYENEKAKSAYTAAGKSLKLNMMQMDSLRQMEEAARKHRR